MGMVAKVGVRVALTEGVFPRKIAAALREEEQRRARRRDLLYEERHAAHATGRVAHAPEGFSAALSSGEEITLPDPSGAPTLGAGAAPASQHGAPAFPVPGWDRYRCLRFLGQGGMGNVFLARDVRLQRDVAVKFVRGDDPSYVHRFLIEARAQARVDHECVCRVHEVGEVSGHIYIAMHYVDGKSLDHWAPELTVEQKAMVLRKAALGMHAAHSVGVVHRDIKPANILVERSDSGLLRPYVMDFGIAHLRAAGGTETGTVLGTPHYMAPEQARGETATLDRRADVYSLGATLYFLLTGQPPLGGEQVVDVLSRIAAEDPRPPHFIDRDVPRDLSAIVMKCLEKERSRRYGSARELADDLDRFLHGEPVSARRARALDPLRRWVRRNRWTVAALAVGLSAVVLALGWGLSVRQEVNQRERFTRQFTELAMYVESLARYSALAPMHSLAGDRSLAHAAMEALAADIEAAGPVADAPGHYALGRAYLALDDYDHAEGHLEAAWQSGLREPRLAYGLALVKGHRYRTALVEAKRIDGAAQRAARIHEIERSFRAPALEYLRLCAGAMAPSRDYVAALSAYYEGRTDDALKQLDALGTGLPWFYEAPGLRGDILLARAIDRWHEQSFAGATHDFEGARQAYTEAVAVGRSVPAAHEALGELSAAEMEMELHRGGDVARAFDQGMLAVSQALAIAPERSSAARLSDRLKELLAEHGRRQAKKGPKVSTCRGTSVDASVDAIGAANCAENQFPPAFEGGTCLAEEADCPARR
jgi:predicted Ser/Thr protein kinase/tetratricopeptide (TPR) repeat protein